MRGLFFLPMFLGQGVGTLSKEDVRGVACFVSTISSIRQVLTKGHKPLLVINGVEVGTVDSLPQQCKGHHFDSKRIEGLEFAKPGHAVQAFGEKGKDGVIQVRIRPDTTDGLKRPQ